MYEGKCVALCVCHVLQPPNFVYFMHFHVQTLVGLLGRCSDEHTIAAMLFQLYTICLVLIVGVCFAMFYLPIHHIDFLSHFLLKVKKKHCAKCTTDFENSEHTPLCPFRDWAYSNQ